MSRMYTAQFNAVAVSAQQDLFELVCAATGIILIHRIELSQSSEVGDAQEEGLNILLKSGQTTSGSGGSSVTPVPRMLGQAASVVTAEANNTTKATAGTIVTRKPWNWNVRVPFDHVFTPEERPVISPSARMTLELATTPADALTMSGCITFEELG